VPIGGSVCYEILNVPTYEEFRCWWSGRAMMVNGQMMACNGDGNNYLPLPPSVGGGYCVYFYPSSNEAAKSDGFAMGVR
jgi:hypothetical protein